MDKPNEHEKAKVGLIRQLGLFDDLNVILSLTSLLSFIIERSPPPYTQA